MKRVKPSGHAFRVQKKSRAVEDRKMRGSMLGFVTINAKTNNDSVNVTETGDNPVHVNSGSDSPSILVFDSESLYDTENDRVNESVNESETDN